MTRFRFLAGAAAIIGAVVSMAGPTTAPAQPPAASVPASPAPYSSVLVLPFAPTSGTSDWIGKGIQEDLATQLVQLSRLNVLTPSDAQTAADSAAASQLGRERGASLVAFGTYQIVDSDVRINGRLIDTATGKALAALQATGPRRDLFHMEDLLASQAAASLPPTILKLAGGAYASTNQAVPPAPAGDGAPEPYNFQGYYVTPGPDFTPTYDYSGAPAPASSYVDGYPPAYTSYGYGDPFWGDGFFFIGGFGTHRHDHDHDHDHDRDNGNLSYRPNATNGVGARPPVSQHSPGNDGSHGGTGGHR